MLKTLSHGQVSRLVNMLLRGLTLLSRFFFIFMLAKFLSPSDVGLYGLVTATVGYSLFIVGLDFYTYSTREIAQSDRSHWGWVLKNQASLTLLLYVFLLPTSLLLFQFGLLPWKLAPIFIGLVVVEHICQELMRFYIAASRQLTATVILFLRQALWAVAAVILFFVDVNSRHLLLVLTLWLVSASIAIIYGVVCIYKMKLGAWTKPIDKRWIVKGIKVALPLLVATLAYRALFTVDRYWIESLIGLEVVGAYVIYYGLASTLLAFLDAGVFSYAYPAMIKAYNDDQVALYRKKFKDMVLLGLVLSLMFVAASLVALPWLLDWLDKSVYSDNLSLYYWVLASTVVTGLSYVPHFGLYAQQIDRPIVLSHLLSLPVFFSSGVAVALASPYYAVPVAVLLSQLFVLVWKTVSYVRFSDPRFSTVIFRAE